MIVVKDLNKSIAHKPLLKDVSFTVQPGERIGLVGSNGAGKSTLLKMIAGIEEIDSGTIHLDHETAGYLPQESDFLPTDTIESAISLSSHPQARAILGKVGLGGLAHDMSVTALSGGQKTRLALARLLLAKPSILLLDEPTNHLDIHGLAWLEGFVKQFHGSILIVSHDRTFLDHCATGIFEINPSRKTLTEYAGNYSSYLEQRERAAEIQENAYQLQQREKKRMEQWLTDKRVEASVYDSPAKGKQIRQMEKRLQREIYDQEIDRPGNQKTLSDLQLKGSAAASKLILRVNNIFKSFEGEYVLYNASFEMRGREHCQLAGENGSGKTTLLRIIIDEMSADQGELQWGEGVRCGYFAQDHSTLDPKKTIMDEFMATPRLALNSKNPRSILGKFLFNGDDITKKVGSLSLGERVRLIFAKLTSQEHELLILDEPTNHLDIASREAIEVALSEYKGAILVVSHDRYFLDAIGIDRVLLIDRGFIMESLN